MIKRSFLPFFICLLLSFNCFAQGSDSLINKFKQTPFKISFDKKNIPKSFLRYYYSMQLKYTGRHYAKKFIIVNPNEKFNQFDFGDSLPDRRLICSSKSVVDNVYFIYFEKGAAVQGQKYLYILLYSGNKVKTFLALSMDDDLKTYEGLKKALESKKYYIMK